MMFTWAVIAAGLALLPAAMMAANRRRFTRAPRPVADRPGVSLLIPARNEENAITASLEAALQSTGVELEVIVLDDQSTDRTAERVRDAAREDPRVRLETAPPLPEGWCGKQHACFSAAQLARYDLLAWIDADVLLSPEALSRMVGFLRQSDAPLVTGFPHQQTLTWMERLVVPLIPFVLVGYLPIGRMRGGADPRFGAGCGQLVMARRDAYEQVGGHGNDLVRASLHDGVTLPRAFRKAGRMTDLFDASDIARCRMYRSAEQVWRGFAKNATEGMATPVGVWVWSVLLAGGHVLPWVLLAAAWGFGAGAWTWTLIWLACAAAAYCSVVCGVWFRQDGPSVALRPLGVLVLLAIQWYAYGRKVLGRPSGWRGRAYPAAGGSGS